MSKLRKDFSWASYGKFALMATGAFAASTLVGVPAETAVHLAVGSIIGFPVACRMRDDKNTKGDSPSQPGNKPDPTREEFSRRATALRNGDVSQVRQKHGEIKIVPKMKK